MKFSMNSFSSRWGFGFLFAGRERFIVQWIMRRFVLQKPGSVVFQWVRLRKGLGLGLSESRKKRKREKIE